MGRLLVLLTKNTIGSNSSSTRLNWVLPWLVICLRKVTVGFVVSMTCWISLLMYQIKTPATARVTTAPKTVLKVVRPLWFNSKLLPYLSTDLNTFTTLLTHIIYNSAPPSAKGVWGLGFGVWGLGFGVW